MQFNDTTNEQGFVQEINDICTSDNNSYTLASKARRLNSALDRFLTLAIQADGRWEEDGTNQVDYPIAFTDLEIDKQDYTYPTDLLEVFRVEVQKEDGDWYTLEPIDQREIKSNQYTTNGQPEYYDKKYSAVWLYPASSYDLEKGLKLHFNRKLRKFTKDDTTETAGIPKIFENYLARYASLPFLVEKNRQSANNVAELIRQDEEEIMKYYARRDRDEKTQVLSGNQRQFI